MKALVFLLGFLVAIISTKPLSRTLSFETCGNNSWQVSDVQIVPGDNETEIIANIALGGNFTDTLRQVRINLPRCPENPNCQNNSVATVTNVDCSTGLLTELDQEACDVAERLANYTNTEDFVPGFLISGCLFYEDEFYDDQ